MCTRIYLQSFRLLLSALLTLPSLVVAPRVFAQEELVELVTGLLADQDKEVRALAFDQIRQEAKGEAATRKFAELLPKFPAETQIGLLSALADRGDAAAAPAVRGLLTSSTDETVRVAAFKALGSLGDAGDLKLLVKAMASESQGVREAARDSLVRLPAAATAAMVSQLAAPAAETRVALLEILTARRAREALPAMLAAAGSDDAAVRQAATRALAELAEAEEVAGMVPLVIKTPAGRERDALERAIATVCRREANDKDPAATLLAAMNSLKDAERILLFSTLGRVGGPAALKIVDEAVGSSRLELHEAGTGALYNWPDGSVVSRLLRMARTSEDAGERRRALATLIRVAPLADERSDARRLDTLRTVFVMCSSDAERKTVLERAKAIRNIDTLHFLIPFLDEPAFAQEACLTVVELAHHSSLREANKQEFHGALDQVIEISKDATVIDRAKRYKAGQTWFRPKSAE